MVKLNSEDLRELVELTEQAKRMPVIAMSLREGLEGRDMASLAWDRVRTKWNELGKKYNFVPTQVTGIDALTGEVIVKEE